MSEVFEVVIEVSRFDPGRIGDIAEALRGVVVAGGLEDLFSPLERATTSEGPVLRLRGEDIVARLSWPEGFEQGVQRAISGVAQGAKARLWSHCRAYELEDFAPEPYVERYEFERYTAPGQGPAARTIATCQSCEERFEVEACEECEAPVTDRCMACHLEVVHDRLS